MTGKLIMYVCKPYEYYYVSIASQMWNLAVYLPLMIGDEIPEDDRE